MSELSCIHSINPEIQSQIPTPPGLTTLQLDLKKTDEAGGAIAVIAQKDHHPQDLAALKELEQLVQDLGDIVGDAINNHQEALTSDQKYAVISITFHMLNIFGQAKSFSLMDASVCGMDAAEFISAHPSNQ